MHTKGSAIGIVARLAAIGALIAGAAVATTEVVHDLGVPNTTDRVTATDESETTPDPDVVHDM